MIARAWLLLCALWAFAFIGNGATKVDGIQRGDVIIAAAPWVIGFALVQALRFVVTGSFLPPAEPQVSAPPSGLRR